MAGAAARRALDYPFAIPAGSYVLRADGPEAVDGVDGEALRDRVPVLAIGANAAPERLREKLGPPPAGEGLPVLAARLHGFDVVYSAHISPYGAVPATLFPAPGAVAHVHVIHPTEPELGLLHRTEPNYRFGVLDDASVELPGGERLRSVHAYVSRHGCLALDGGPVGVAPVEVENRPRRALDEPAVLEAVRARLAPEQSLEDFIVQSAGDPSVAQRRTKGLRRVAQDVDLPGWRCGES